MARTGIVPLRQISGGEVIECHQGSGASPGLMLGWSASVMLLCGIVAVVLVPRAMITAATFTAQGIGFGGSGAGRAGWCDVVRREWDADGGSRAHGPRKAHFC